MSNNPPQFPSTNGSTPFTKSEKVHLHLQLAQSQEMVQRLRHDKKKLSDELQESKKKAAHVLEGVASVTYSLKRKHRGEIQGLKQDINTLTNAVRQNRGLPLSPVDESPNSDGVDLSHGTTNDIITRSLKKARLDAPQVSAKTSLSTTPLLTVSPSSNGAAAAPVALTPTTSGIGSRIFIPGIPAMPQPGDFGPPKKHSAERESSDDSTDFLHPARPPEAFPICIFCYMNHLLCDAGEPCMHCAERGRTCKRAKCVNFKGGSCRNPKCLRAHEEDSDYKNIRDAGHVRQKDRKGAKKGGRGGGGSRGGRRITAC